VTFCIRPFQKADFETLWRIDQSCFEPALAYSRPELAFYMRRPGSFTLVAERNGSGTVEAEGQSSSQRAPAPSSLLLPQGRGAKNGDNAVGPEMLGFIVAERPRQKGHIITIDVIAEARRLGVGSALLDAAEARLHKEGAVAVELETAVTNDSAIRFYKQKGYFVEKTVRGYYSNHLDALVMGKELAKQGSG
jgi:ribosomal protein S18 acetylase RimI-like enzyme